MPTKLSVEQPLAMNIGTVGIKHTFSYLLFVIFVQSVIIMG